MATDKQGQQSATNAAAANQGASMQQSAGKGQENARGAVQGQGGGMQADPGQIAGSVTQGASGANIERAQERSPEAGILMPPVDVIEDAAGITLVADMPGVSKESLNLRLEAHSLTIEGALSMDVPADMESRYAEVRSQRYARTFALSRELDGEQATAQLAHGVLKVRIPKAQHAVARKIPVNVA